MEPKRPTWRCALPIPAAQTALYPGTSALGTSLWFLSLPAIQQYAAAVISSRFVSRRTGCPHFGGGQLFILFLPLCLPTRNWHQQSLKRGQDNYFILPVQEHGRRQISVLTSPPWATFLNRPLATTVNQYQGLGLWSREGQLIFSLQHFIKERITAFENTYLEKEHQLLSFCRALHSSTTCLSHPTLSLELSSCPMVIFCFFFTSPFFPSLPHVSTTSYAAGALFWDVHGSRGEGDQGLVYRHSQVSVAAGLSPTAGPLAEWV